MIRTVLALVSVLLVTSYPSKAQQANDAYLFAYFTGNGPGEEAIHFALSKDGYRFRALNNDQPILNSKEISSAGGVRDPHIMRGADGKTFYMVATDMVSAKGWNSNRAMVLLRSTDLVHWTSHVVNIQQRFPGNDSLLRVWAPQTIYDPAAKKYMIYWSMKHGRNPDKIYYAYANADFSDLETEPKQLFFSPTNDACIDGDIVVKDGKYYLFYKTEDRRPGIRIAVSNQLTGGYVAGGDYVQQTTDPVEGAGVFKLNNDKGYILMYDVYTKGRYQFTYTTDLEHFKVVDQDVSMNFHPRHGTVISVTAAEVQRLESEWGSAEDVIGSARSKQARMLNTRMDTTGKALYLSIKPGTNLRAFDPEFTVLPGIDITPKGKADFSRGPVTYSIAIKGQAKQVWKVYAEQNNNPVLDGYYADPDILYSEKTGKFYLYPTSDGFNGWSGTYFKTFSSTDLVNWKDEGVILDLPRDVSWGKKNAWAPAILEKKMDGQYKYFFYFTAAQKIGVATADKPEGPFTDAGKALVDQRPPGAKGGQTIDPDVFTDPVSGKTYLYWGNGYMACAELNDDMVSLKPDTVKLLTPDRTFREGTTVFYRNGKYYFLWSEDDTRSVNYRVRYGTSDSPTGKITVPASNLVIAKDTTVGIYATGHNSVIKIPGKDEWYIVYHRFNYPNGVTMAGGAGGFHREVCIDKLTFDSAGNIIQVIPTHKGIQPVKIAAK